MISDAILLSNIHRQNCHLHSNYKTKDYTQSSLDFTRSQVTNVSMESVGHTHTRARARAHAHARTHTLYFSPKALLAVEEEISWSSPEVVGSPQ